MVWYKDLDKKVEYAKKYGIKKASEMLGITYGSLRTFLWANDIRITDDVFEERKALIQEYGTKEACKMLSISEGSLSTYLRAHGTSIKEIVLNKVFDDWFKRHGFDNDDWEVMRIAFEAGMEFQKQKNITKNNRKGEWK